MQRPVLPTFAFVPAMLLLTSSFAAAAPPHLAASTPVAEAILDGRNQQFVVRFDAPIDHAAARLAIVRNGNVVERLHPLLDSAPDVLFASASALAPGHYTLHWHVGAASGGDVAEWDIPFTVR